jgi:hypothetical protein
MGTTTAALIVSLALVVIALLLFGFFFFHKPPVKTQNDKKESASGLRLSKTGPKRPGSEKPGADSPRYVCPVCGTELEAGEQVQSEVYGGGRYMDGSPRDRIALIKGCKYCLEGLKTRRCPVCHAILSGGDYLVAELKAGSVFKPGSKPHITIIGCSQCQRQNRDGLSKKN